MFDLRKEIPSLELCKRLKELGFPQDSGGWYWVKFADRDRWRVMYDGIIDYEQVEEVIKAPTVRELGEWLPDEFVSGRVGENNIVCFNLELDPAVRSMFPTMNADTEANARAKVLIWLVENKYVDFERSSG